MPLHRNKNAQLRWFWMAVMVCQFQFGVLMLLLSIRSVWSFVNKFIDGVIGLGDYSFPFVFSILIISFLFSLSLAKSFKGIKRKKYLSAKVTFLLFQWLVFVLIFLQLYPDLKSMYLSQLPYWLWEEWTMQAFVLFSLFVTACMLLYYIARKDFVLKVLIVGNGILFSVVLAFLWMALTVRSFDFGKNSLKRALKSSNDYFMVSNHDAEIADADSLSLLKPDISLKIDMENGGNYLIAGDLTGDSVVEIITLKYWVEPTDVNRVKSLAVQSMLPDSISGERGKTLWSWSSDYESPRGLNGGRGSSAAVAVFDLETGQANKKLLMASDGWLYEFTFNANGFVSEKKVATGEVGASDCLIIANLDGNGRHHLLLKDAYHTLWAYDKDLNLLWKKKNPGGYMLAHRIGAYDVNNDGKDEILAGATILNGKGDVIALLKTNSVKLWYGGHIDGIVPIEQNGKWNIAVTYCDGLGFALFDTNGNIKWELTGDHFEYLVGGYFFNTPELKDQFQFISKVHYREGNPQVMMNQDGKLLGMFNPSSPVFSVDWTGNGYHEMVFASPASIWSGTEKIVDLTIPGQNAVSAFSLRVADIIGKKGAKSDGLPDIALRSVNGNGEHVLYLYANKQGQKPINYVYPGIGWESSANYFTKYYEYERE